MEQKILTNEQLKLLNIISDDKEIVKRFYLSDGTALTTFYIPYRFSEDLDFFSVEDFEAEAILAFFKKNKGLIGYKTFDFQRSFNRNLIFLDFQKKDALKLEFTYFPFPQVEKPIKKMGIKIDGLLDIAVNKVFTISQKPRTRDFMDLYAILEEKGWDFLELLKKARIKFDWHIDPVNLGSQLMKAENMKDYPKLVKKIDDKKWQSFFLETAKKLGEQI